MEKQRGEEVGEIEISGEKDKLKDDRLRWSDSEIQEDCRENCPEWRKTLTGSGRVEGEM